tara:strand:- start:780 stop:1211 length:432 start_codon:yes stop_codon:yes gene_type:complete
MKTTILTSAMLLTLFASTATQATQYVFVAKGADTVHTELCKTAGESGMTAATLQANYLGVNARKFKNLVTCNGMTPAKFSKKYSAIALTKEIESTKRYQFVPSDKDAKTNDCIKAVKGETSTFDRSTMCNGMPIHRFIRKYKA